MTTQATVIVPEESEEPAIVFTCANCEADFTDDDDMPQVTVYRRLTSSAEYCQNCADNYSVYSEAQNIHIHSDYAVQATDTGEFVLARYAEQNWYYDSENDSWYEHEDSMPRHRERATFNYHETNPIEQFGWPTATPQNSLCFGVELEMERLSNDDEGSDAEDDGNEEDQAYLSEALGGRTGKLKPNHYILMNDGSLNNSGVELITAPFTLEYHQKQFEWDKVLAPVAKIAMSGKGTTRCGMHVHVNRKAISALTLGKMLVFVNSPGNDALIERIAQRDSDRWAKRYEKKLTQGIEVESDKYEALHLASRTIEFRIFRGNLRPDRVLKNIEFCHSVVTYCKQAGMKEVTGYSDYIAWLGKNRGMYPNLVTFLGESYGFKINKHNKANKEI